MQSELFLNPFDNAVFGSLVLRILAMYGVAVVVLLVAKKGNLKAAISSGVGQRIIGWLILTPLYLVGIFSGLLPGITIALLFLSGAVIEASRIAKLNVRFHFGLLVMSGLSLLIASQYTDYFYSLPLIYFMVFTTLAIGMNDAKESFRQASTAIYISIWLIFSLSHIVLLGEFNNELDSSRALLFLVIFAVALADVGGFVIGKSLHKLNILDNYKVATNLSPNKTYVGTLGYVVGAGIAIWLMYFALESYLSFQMWILVAVIIGVFSFVGGLTHSFFKRHFDVKDSGSLIPGHGGVIDRVDSMARVVVILFYFLSIFI